MQHNRVWLTALEIGQEIGVDGATIRNWIKQGLIPERYVLILPHKKRGAIRIHQDALTAITQVER